MGSDKSLLNDFKLRFTFIVGTVVQFPFFIEFKFPVADILIVIKRPD